MCSSNSFSLRSKYTIVLLLIAVVLVFVAVLLDWRPSEESDLSVLCPEGCPRTAVLRMGTSEITAEVVKTPESRSQGLSGRPSLSPRTGMFFVFDALGRYGFWMKDMQFPVDVVWLGDDLSIVHMWQDASPDSFPAVLTPDTLARYVLEVPAGAARAAGVSIGDRLEFLRNVSP